MFLKVCYGDNTLPKTTGEVSATELALPHLNVTPIGMVHPSESKSVTQVNLDKLLCWPCLPWQGYCV